MKAYHLSRFAHRSGFGGLGEGAVGRIWYMGVDPALWEIILASIDPMYGEDWGVEDE